MKYVLILPDGAADEPVEELNGLTPLQAARKPHIDWIAQNGRIGTVKTVPDEFLPGSDVATLSVVGYDPRKYYTGRAPLEAAAQNLPVGTKDLVFRCNLTTIIDETMIDFSAGHISQPEAEMLITDLNQSLANDQIRFFPGVGYRHLMVMKDVDRFEVKCTPPHDIPDQPIAQYLPQGPDATLLKDLMRKSQSILENHPVNLARKDLGESPATSIWLWGQGRMPQLPTFSSIHGIQGACITAVDLIRGISVLAGWNPIAVQGATGYLDTNYRGKGQSAIQALSKYDMIMVHIEAPDEAGHMGNAQEKVRAIEQIDEHIVGPLLQALRSFEQWRILLLPDHPTPVAKKSHTRTPPPFCMAGWRIPNIRKLDFTEENAERSDLHIDPGHELMEFFLKPR